MISVYRVITWTMHNNDIICKRSLVVQIMSVMMMMFGGIYVECRIAYVDQGCDFR